MSGQPRLIGYRHSVYTRAARIALIEKNVDFEETEHDPFTGEGVDNSHAFGRVPVLCHGEFTIYETAAITAYVADGFDGPALVPSSARVRAREAQVIGIIDSYAYWPLVRQVYSHGAFRPAMAEPADEKILSDGMRAAPRVLAALEAIAAEGLSLGQVFTRADCHLVPMIGAFRQVPQAAEMLRDYPALTDWWARVAERASVKASETPLSSTPEHR